MVALKQLNLTPAKYVLLAFIIFIFGHLVNVTGALANTERVEIGKFKSRGLWTQSDELAPAVLLIPGSGAHGPEEAIPGQLTTDGEDAYLFEQISEPFIEAGYNVLSLGKPGVEFFSSFNGENLFYDMDMYRQLTWNDLIENVAEGVRFLRGQKNVKTEQIYLLGHSEGTQVAVDFGTLNPEIAGYFLLGYSGESIKTTLEWQLFRRSIDYFIASDVDLNKDGFIDPKEAALWPEFQWDWRKGQDRISYAEIEEAYRQNPNILGILESTKSSPLYGGGVFNRKPLYDQTARLRGDIAILTGSLDLQTRPGESLRAGLACERALKGNYQVHILPKLQHGFSPPKGPRRHPLLDISVGPVGSSTLNLLKSIAVQKK